MDGRFIWDNTTGARYLQHPDGSMTLAPETGPVESALVSAGAKLTDYGRGIQHLFANQQDDNALRQEQQQSEDAIAPLRSEYPVATTVGSALPALATAPLSAEGLLPSIALQMGLGGAEGLLDFDTQDGSQFDNALRGAGYGLLGEIGGRMAGRVFNSVKGLIDDVRTGNTNFAANPAARELEAAGGRTLPSQRLHPDDPYVAPMRRMEEGAESSIVAPSIFREVDQANRELYTNTALDAIGARNHPGVTDLGPESLGTASDRISGEFERLTRQAGGVRPMNIGADLAERIGRDGQIRALIDRGEFRGLEQGVLSGSEYSVARQALSEDAADWAARGKGVIANRLYGDVERLDNMIEPHLDPAALGDWARVREQYRVLQILQKPGVIKDGEISVKSLNRAIHGESGFGKTAREARGTTNPESQTLINLARVGSDRSLQRLQSSGTTERQALRELASHIGNLDVINTAGQIALPAAVGISARTGGRGMAGILSPAAPIAGRLGSAVTRGTLDDLLYPYVGSEYEGGGR